MEKRSAAPEGAVTPGRIEKAGCTVDVLNHKEAVEQSPYAKWVHYRPASLFFDHEGFTKRTKKAFRAGVLLLMETEG